jgi:hypothetical protein
VVGRCDSDDDDDDDNKQLYWAQHTHCGKCKCRHTKEFNIADRAICTINSTRRIGCHTVYPRNMVCFRYISVNTLRKGDDVMMTMMMKMMVIMIIIPETPQKLTASGKSGKIKKLTFCVKTFLW